MTDPSPPPDALPARPPWARRADAAVLRAARLLGRLLGRPSEAALHRLARADRPAPPVRVPTAAELGIVDHLGDGRAALADGRPGDALHHFGQLLETAPDHAWAWHGRGDALQLLGDHDGALAAYRRAAARQPTTGIHRLGAANALAALGQTAAADDETRAGLALDPSLTWMRPAP